MNEFGICPECGVRRIVVEGIMEPHWVFIDGFADKRCAGVGRKPRIMELKHRLDVARYISLMVQRESMDEVDADNARDIMDLHWHVMTPEERAFCNEIAREVVTP